jgi:hypothetical protein
LFHAENFQPLLAAAVNPALLPFVYSALQVPDSLLVVAVFVQSI